MTKKHFIALADCLRALQTDIDRQAENVPSRDEQGYQIPAKRMIEVGHVGRMILRDLAGFCSDQNGRFDRQRWMGYIVGDNGPNGGAR